MGCAIRAEGVVKRYGGRPALDGLDLTVAEGTVHGLLGPNGAGKTTAVRVLTTLTGYEAGRAEVCGCDVRTEAERLRGMIGLTGQYAAVDETLSGRQNLVMFGRLLRLGRRAAGRRAAELLEQFDLGEAADRSAGGYSGGMRRRLDLAVGLVRTPTLLFLDEPTTGLDPRSRAQVWGTVRELAAGGTTVLLTTQYLEEADLLADRISVMNRGRVVAEGTSDELKSVIGADRVEAVARHTEDLPRLAEVIGAATGARVETDPDTRRVGAPAVDRVATLTGVAREVERAGIALTDLGTRRPTLDEVFLHLTAPPGGPTSDRRDANHDGEAAA
ncbi:ATP-binding cassette domain-containing protein [Streptomyces spiramenti]|uniref:ATP-binding cassette domain-containing protein n=1 Tax=Streptomyces spiramenti TaxID=2720606 RepID=A0ABX1AXJ4_9ACTN|nr:ATP-binding cassette domain-containing protein [Streptomyces spiramenti]NJP69050.1 ATP-binding cassette domain-containing protein [Streptomyces spiramenti]